ncbi:MAG: hypothetical protein PHQ32_01630 [Firmicutes bacterium]|nr:hypothetical protein [Bacillota bacterium]
MENKTNKTNKTKISKKEIVIKKKRKKLTQEKKIQIIAISFVVIFVGSILAGGVASLVYNNNNTPSNYTEIDSKPQLLQSATEYEAKIKANPEDSESLYNLVEIYAQLGYYERNAGNEELAVTNFLKAVDYATLLKDANPQLETSADYLRAGYLAEAGNLDEAKAIYEAVIASNTDPLISRVVYADFLKNKEDDATGSAAQVQAAKDAAINDEETTYVESLLKQYNLN